MILAMNLERDEPEVMSSSEGNEIRQIFVTSTSKLNFSKILDLTYLVVNCEECCRVNTVKTLC